jgi:hypothetical protein
MYKLPVRMPFSPSFSVNWISMSEKLPGAIVSGKKPAGAFLRLHFGESIVMLLTTSDSADALYHQLISQDFCTS